MNDAQGTEMAAEESQPARPFALAGAWVSTVAWVRTAFGRSRSGGENDVEERIRSIEAELEQARRLDGSAPNRRRLP